MARRVKAVVKITYLQMFAQPQRSVPPPREGITIVHAKKPPAAYYRFLYDAVGKDYDWTSRKKLSHAELAALLNDPRISAMQPPTPLTPPVDDNNATGRPNAPDTGLLRSPISRSVHSSCRLRQKRSTCAFRFGDCGGKRTAFVPASLSTRRNDALNLLSRSINR
jgi:hypothetical protein